MRNTRKRQRTLNKHGNIVNNENGRNHLLSAKFWSSTKDYDPVDGEMTMLESPNDMNDSINDSSSNLLLKKHFLPEEEKHKLSAVEDDRVQIFDVESFTEKDQLKCLQLKSNLQVHSELKDSDNKEK